VLFSRWSMVSRLFDTSQRKAGFFDSENIPFTAEHIFIDQKAGTHPE
jgi:hypothetical protein